MKLVVDCNRIIAALIKDSTTREILCDTTFDFVAPEFILEEINKYKSEIYKKAGISDEELELVISILFENINIIPKEDYEHHLIELKKAISDVKDIPYLTCCIATKAQGIWTHDPHFKGQNRVKVFTNIELINYLRQ